MEASLKLLVLSLAIPLTALIMAVGLYKVEAKRQITKALLALAVLVLIFVSWSALEVYTTNRVPAWLISYRVVVFLIAFVAAVASVIAPPRRTD